ncbi:MAG: iron complex transport system permease protein, partial [Arenicella sp.]
MNKSVIIFSLILALPILLVLSMATGAMDLKVSEIIQILAYKANISFNNFEPSSIQNAIVWDIRLPRVFMSMLVGASLGICGT